MWWMGYAEKSWFIRRLGYIYETIPWKPLINLSGDTRYNLIKNPVLLLIFWKKKGDIIYEC